MVGMCTPGVSALRLLTDTTAGVMAELDGTFPLLARVFTDSDEDLLDLPVCCHLFFVAPGCLFPAASFSRIAALRLSVSICPPVNVVLIIGSATVQSEQDTIQKKGLPSCLQEIHSLQ